MSIATIVIGPALLMGPGHRTFRANNFVRFECPSAGCLYSVTYPEKLPKHFREKHPLEFANASSILSYDLVSVREEDPVTHAITVSTARAYVTRIWAEHNSYPGGRVRPTQRPQTIITNNHTNPLLGPPPIPLYPTIQALAPAVVAGEPQAQRPQKATNNTESEPKLTINLENDAMDVTQETDTVSTSLEINPGARAQMDILRQQVHNAMQLANHLITYSGFQRRDVERLMNDAAKAVGGPMNQASSDTEEETDDEMNTTDSEEDND